jgi:cell division protease FtsH
MVVQFGMSELGPINLDGEKRMMYEPSDLSPEMAAKIDAQVKKMTDAAYKQAMDVLSKLRDKLDILAKELLTKETIESDDFAKLIGAKPALAHAKVRSKS